MHKITLSSHDLSFSPSYDNRAASDWRIVANDVPQGTLITANTPNGNAALFSSTATNSDIPAVGKLAAHMKTAAADIAKIVSETIPAKIMEKIEPVIRKLVQDFLNARLATVRVADKIALDEATAIQLPSSYDAALAGEVIKQWGNLTKGQKLEAIADWPPFAIQAVARTGQQLSGLSEEEWQHVMLDRIRAVNIRREISPDNPNFALTPNAEHPIARGIDEVKVNLSIDDANRIHDARVSNVLQAEAMLRDVVLFASVTLGKSSAEAFDILMGKDRG